MQPIGLHIETALVSEVWSGLGDLFVGFVKLSFCSVCWRYGCIIVSRT